MGYVYLTLTVDLLKCHNLILGFDIKLLLGISYLERKMMKSCILNKFLDKSNCCVYSILAWTIYIDTIYKKTLEQTYLKVSFMLILYFNVVNCILKTDKYFDIYTEGL